jgi:integral membrane protein (TIGR00529 family)
MIELLKLSLVLFLLIFLIKMKVHVGISLLGGGILLGILFGMPIFQILKKALFSAVEKETLNLLGVVILIVFFGNLLKLIENLTDLTKAIENLVRNTKVVLMMLPAMIGLLPMPGGALLSAPMVEEIGARRGLSPEIKTTMNYWFRHVWECCFPLYQGIILSAALLQVHLWGIIAVQIVLSLAMIILGLAFCTTKVKLQKSESGFENEVDHPFLLLVKSIWPVVLVVVLNLFFKVDLLIGLSLTIILLILLRKVKSKDIVKITKETITFDVVVLILGIMIFKNLLDASGAVKVMPEQMLRLGIPKMAVAGIIPLAVGMLTGVTSAFVGVSYPILLPFLIPHQVDWGLVMLVYACGFIGVMLSPVHFCLILTKDYFKADLLKVYKMILPPALLLILFAFILVVFGYPWVSIKP